MSNHTICGTVPLPALSGTNLVTSPMTAADHTLYYIAGVVVVMVVIVIAILVMRSPKKSPQRLFAPFSILLPGPLFAPMSNWGRPDSTDEKQPWPASAKHLEVTPGRGTGASSGRAFEDRAVDSGLGGPQRRQVLPEPQRHHPSADDREEAAYDRSQVRLS